RSARRFTKFHLPDQAGFPHHGAIHVRVELVFLAHHFLDRTERRRYLRPEFFAIRRPLRAETTSVVRPHLGRRLHMALHGVEILEAQVKQPIEFREVELLRRKRLYRLQRFTLTGPRRGGQDYCRPTRTLEQVLPARRKHRNTGKPRTL